MLKIFRSSAAALMAVLLPAVIAAGQEQDPAGSRPAAEKVILVRFEPKPSGSVVLIDGILRCAGTPCTVPVAGGSREVEVQAIGNAPEKRRVEFKGDQSVAWELKADSGHLVVTSPVAGTQLMIDGSHAGRMPVGKIQLPAGPHKLLIQSPCHLDEGRDFEITAGKETRLNVNPRPKESMLDVSAENENGAVVRAEILVDGVKSGTTPATLKVQTCVKDIRVEDPKAGFYRTKPLLFPNKVTAVRAVLRKSPQALEGLASEMVEIPAGDFWMGCRPEADHHCSSDEQPYHRVTLSAYRIDKYEVTAGDYGKCVDAGACTPANRGSTCNYGTPGREDHPINCVDWVQANRFCKWAGKRLPTEAEWEKAARGAGGSTFPWGDNDPGPEHVVGKGALWKHGCTEKVGTKPRGASPFGAMDMSGNVWEWVADWYGENYYSMSPIQDPRGPEKGSAKVLKGGCWYSMVHQNFRPAERSRNLPGLRLDFFGFRCAQ